MSLESLKRRVENLEKDRPAKTELQWPPLAIESLFNFTLYQCLIRERWIPPANPPKDQLGFLLSEYSKLINWND
jgi:hypothetical protein